jgi:hypothetical protein
MSAAHKLKLMKGLPLHFIIGFLAVPPVFAKLAAGSMKGEVSNEDK